MNKILSATIDIFLFIVFFGAINVLAFSSLAFALEFFGADLPVTVAFMILCLAIATLILKVWLFFYLCMDINIFGYKKKKIKEIKTK